METSALKPATEEHLDGSTLTSQSEQKESTNGDTNTAKEVGDAEAETYMLPIPTQAGIIGLASLMGNEDGGHTPDEDADSGCSVLSYGSFVDVSPDLGDAKSASSTCSPVSNRDGQAKQPQMSSSTCPEANTADGPAGEGFAIGTDSHCRLEGIQQPQGMFALTVPGVEEIPRLPAPHLPCSPSSESFQIVTMPKPPAPEPQSPHETAKGLFGPGSPRSLRGDPGVEMDKLAVYTDSRAPSRTTSVNAPQNVSWHCRSCQKTPCNAPTATICGHIFCQSCIVHELSTTGCCPVCNKVFLLGLDVYI
ncbi:hypothetical protein C8Q77DRAFT_1104076 [Trametes polyzona]|nr:hypothetical protein C8Q77DRAFT_1104076 [Trametes polyzona]